MMMISFGGRVSVWVLAGGIVVGTGTTTMNGERRKGRKRMERRNLQYYGYEW